MAMGSQVLSTPLLPVEALQPALRAYALAYAASTAPRLFGFLRLVTRRDVSTKSKLDILYKILKTPAQLRRFPASCAIIVGGSTALPRLLNTLFRWLLSLNRRTLSGLEIVSLQRLRFICTFLSAWFAFDLLNDDKSWARKRALSRGVPPPLQLESKHPNQHHLPPPGSHMRYAGKTIDFTSFAVVRALDVLIITAWTRSRSRRWHPEQETPKFAEVLRKIADPCVFSASAAVIMWSWFFCPERLPRDYNHWISKAADIDLGLIQVLKLCREGEFVYGLETGHGHHLDNLCKRLNLPREWGDPTLTIPIPCTLYHSGTGPSCEVHAASRFWRSWKFSMRIYLPLQLLSLLRRSSAINGKRLVRLFKSAARSSSFLAAFISFFYYGVCLARTRIGPALFSRTTVTPQMWDSGLCVLAGCLACGWSILFEAPARRQEIAFFVAPRALATLVPRVYDKQNQRREQIAFATSVAIVLNAVQSRTDHHVRGVFGSILQKFITT